MSTMNISLPEELKAFVDQQVAARAYSSASEYMRELLRRERDIEHLRGLLLEGLESGPGRVVDAAYFDELRERIRQHAAAEPSLPSGPAPRTSTRGAKASSR